MKYFEYGEKEIEYLKKKDKKLAAVIEQVGHIDRAVCDDLFASVVYQIVGQQISTKAQHSIWNRILDELGAVKAELDAVSAGAVQDEIGAVSAEAINDGVAGVEAVQDEIGEVSAEAIIKCGRERLQSCGISFRKADYILDFAWKVKSGQLNIDAIPSMSDDEVIEALTSLRGVGVWTAEMLLLFCLRRPNVFSYGDLAIRRGLKMVYHHKEITREQFERYRRRFSPYCSVASLYLWAVAGGAIPEASSQRRKTSKSASEHAER